MSGATTNGSLSGGEAADALSPPAPTDAGAILARYAEGAVSAEVAVAQLLIALGSVANVRRALGVGAHAPLERLLDAHVDGCRHVEAIVEMDRARGARGRGSVSAREAVAGIARMFDEGVRRSEEASVALYSLGSPERLAAATAELVDLFARRGWLGRARRALDVGCGIGRVAIALASHLGAIEGVDVAPAMIDAAARRCGAHPNVRLTLGEGVDLAAWPDAHFDLVYAIDSFPYVVEAGAGLAARTFAEMARVLAPGGDLVVMNWSYRGDPAADRREAARFAARHGLAVATAGARPLTLWDGVEFSFRRPAARGV